MTLEERIKAFVLLGKAINEISEEEFGELSWKIENNNNWFIPDQTRLAFLAISEMLQEDKLRNWVKSYALIEEVETKDIGILMAGNIPAVGFHDLLCVLIAGHHASVKLSSADLVSIKWLMDKLFAIEPKFSSLVSFEDMLKGKDAYIATGSDNSARYFNYYFGKYPHIIRKNRTSVAVLDGSETASDYQELAKDVFQYFGMGCRNVSKIFINQESSLIGFLDNINGFQFLGSHHKYLNNYDYNKSIYLVNKDTHFDNGFLLLKESHDLVSPIGVLYYEYYQDLEDLKSKINPLKEKVQCIVSRGAWFENSIPFGEAQCPGLADYADGVDTMEFLIKLK